MKAIIFVLITVVSQMARAECKLPANFTSQDVDVLAGQVIATLKVSRNVTVCTCDEKGMSALMTEVQARQTINKKTVYTSAEMGTCSELKSE